MRLGRIFGFLPVTAVIALFSWKFFFHENPNFYSFAENHAKQVDTILLSSILLLLITALCVGSIQRSVRVHFTKNRLFVTPNLARSSYRIEDISKFRIQQAEEDEYEVFFNYRSEKEEVRLLTNLYKHEAEKAVFWL